MEKKKEVKETSEKKKKSIKQVIKDIIKPSHMVIDFGSDSIKIVYGHFNNKVLEVFGHSIIPVGRELVDDGKVLNPLEVASLLQKSIEQNDIKVADVTLVLSGSDIVIREIQIPKVDEKEVGKIIEFEAQQYFPIELTEYMTDYKILDEVNVDNEERLRILLVAVPLEQIRDYIKVAECLGVHLKSIDLLINTTLKYFLGNNYMKEFRKEEDGAVPEFSFSSLFTMDLTTSMKSLNKYLRERINSLKSKNEEEDEQLEEGKEPGKLGKIKLKLKEARVKIISKLKKKVKEAEDHGVEQEKGAIYALLDMGAKTTSIYIYSDHRLRFNRTLLTGGDELDKEISKEMTLSEEDAKNLKLTRGNLVTNENESQLFEDSENFNKALTLAFGNIMNDTSRFLEFYNSRSTEGSIKKIYIYGGASKLRGAKEYMTDFFNIPVEYLENGHYKVSYTGANKDDYELNKRSLVNVIGGLIK